MKNKYLLAAQTALERNQRHLAVKFMNAEPKLVFGCDRCDEPAILIVDGIRMCAAHAKELRVKL